MEFIARASETALVDDHVLLFNLFLVSRRARPATLVEVIDHNRSEWWDRTRDFYQLVQSVYREFVYRIGPERDGEISYFFAASEKLPEREEGETEDGWVGRVLGFDCCGIPLPEETEVRFTLAYQLLIPGAQPDQEEKSIQFYTEIYRADQPSHSKLAAFDACARELGWRVVEERREIVEGQAVIDAFFNGGARGDDPEWLIKHECDFQNVIYNASGGSDLLDDIPLWEILDSSGQLGTATTEKRKSFRSWAAFLLCR